MHLMTMPRFRLLFVLLAAIFAAPAVFAQSFLPASVSNWTSTAAPIEATPADLNQIAGPATAALQEYGIKSAESRTYNLGAASFAATVYEFQDAGEAYGAYSFLRAPDMAPADFTKHSLMSPNHALVLTGNLVVEFTGRNLQNVHGEMEMLVAAAGGHALWGVYPALPQRLPADGMVPRTDHYILGPVALNQFLPLGNGDWLGLSVGAEAELARYHFSGSTGTLLVVDYPTPQIAASQMDKLSKEFNLDGPAKNGLSLYAKRDGTFLSLVSGAPTQHSAEALLTQVHSGMVITWNVPTPDPKQPSMALIVVGTIIGTGQICGISLLGGLAFAGIRVLVKRQWPGKIFDRTEDREVIQLALTGKPINVKGLY